MKKYYSIIVSSLMIFALLTGCSSDKDSPETSDTKTDAVKSGEVENDVTEDTSAEDGLTKEVTVGTDEFKYSFTLEITDNNDKKESINIETNEETVGAALIEEGIIEGDESEYGFYITSVNGIEAVYETDKAYWAFYIDGDYAATGVSETNIEQGKIYGLIYTKD